jgi:hypothetical protein
MQSSSTKRITTRIIIAVLGIGVIVLLVFLIKSQFGKVEEENTNPVRTVIGTSVEGRVIEAFTFLPKPIDQKKNTNLLFVGGIHGGYEWNSVLLAYMALDYYTVHPDEIPDSMTLTIIPDANPDGTYAVVGKGGRFTVSDVPDGKPTAPGRFNANGVDLNRNFDCKWKPESTWRGDIVSAGSGAFSEPESKALRDFILENKPDAVVFWHSQSNAVYASECENGILPETLDIMNAYSHASGYSAVDSFDAYEITGDAEGWLASIGIPAITVELETHETIEWERNLLGIEALFEYFR